MSWFLRAHYGGKARGGDESYSVLMDSMEDSMEDWMSVGSF